MSSKRSKVEVSRAARLKLGLAWDNSMGATAQATPRKGDGGGGGGLLGGSLWGGASWDRMDRARRWVAASIVANCLQRDRC
jgi:hypothetical protein